MPLARRNVLALVVSSLGMLGLAADEPADAQAQGALKRLQGTWSVVSFVRDGKASAPEKIEGRVVVITGNTWVDRTGETIHGQGTLTLNPGATPMTIDATFTAGFPKGKTTLGIYALEGDSLRACSAVVGDARPEAFASPEGSKRMLVEYRRSK